MSPKVKETETGGKSFLMAVYVDESVKLFLSKALT